MQELIIFQIHEWEKTYPQILQFTIVSRLYVGLVTRGFRAKVSQTYTGTECILTTFTHSLNA